MEPYQPAWFEEPVHHKDVLGTARVGHGTRIPEEIARHPHQETAYLPLFRVGWERRDPNVATETR